MYMISAGGEGKTARQRTVTSDDIYLTKSVVAITGLVHHAGTEERIYELQ